MSAQGALDFSGPAYVREQDQARLSSQLDDIQGLMRDGTWRTLGEISHITGHPAASVSAQLRHLRRPEFGSWTVEKRSRGDRARGLFEYRLLPGGACAEPPRKTSRRIRELATENARLKARVAELEAGR